MKITNFVSLFSKNYSSKGQYVYHHFTWKKMPWGLREMAVQSHFGYFLRKKLFWYSVDEWVYQISGLYRFMFMLGVRHIRTVKIENHLPREFWDIWSRVSRDDNYPTFSNHFFRVLGRKSSTSIALMLHMLIWASDRSLL